MVEKPSLTKETIVSSNWTFTNVSGNEWIIKFNSDGTITNIACPEEQPGNILEKQWKFGDGILLIYQRPELPPTTRFKEKKLMESGKWHMQGVYNEQYGQINKLDQL